MSLANNLYTARTPPAGRNSHWAALDLSFSLVVDLSFQELGFDIQIRRPPPFVHLCLYSGTFCPKRWLRWQWCTHNPSRNTTINYGAGAASAHTWIGLRLCCTDVVKLNQLGSYVGQKIEKGLNTMQASYARMILLISMPK